MNGPTVLFNGRCHLRLRSAAVPIHGLSAGVRPGAYLPPAGGPAGDGAEIYHDDDSIHAINPNEITYHHLHLTHSPTVALASMEEVPSPSPSYCLRRRSPG